MFFALIHNRNFLQLPTVIAVLAGSLFFLSVFGGGNVDRILLPVGLCFALAVSLLVKTRTQVVSFCLCAVGYIISQNPTHIIGKGESDLLRFVDFWHTSTLNEVISFGVIPLLLGLPFTLAGFLILRSKKEDSPTHSL
jgi:hypothetical protein